MRIKAQALTQSAFAPYGSYLNMDEADADHEGPFSYYPDLTAALIEHGSLVGFSACGINPGPMRADMVEHHEHTEEAEFIIDGDCAVLAGERSGAVPGLASFKAFIVPKRTLIRFKRYVWHYVPFPLSDARVAVLTVLPPYTYTNDSVVVRLDEAVEIEL
jgi:ureidoglycolate hydrolase